MDFSNSNKPGSNSLKQQRMRAFQPIYSVKSITVIFILLAVLFLTVGCLLLLLATSVSEFSKRYDDSLDCTLNCETTIKLDSRIEKPVYLYYQITDFYQNHRKYVKSREEKQLKGEILTIDEVDDCGPVTENSDLDALFSLNETPLNPKEPANPCGLAAKTVFTDTFQLFQDTESITIKETGIAWDSDLKYLYDSSEDSAEIQWYNVVDEHFPVWMRLAGHPTFRKLWGIIDQDLEDGEYIMKVNNTFAVSEWSGEKAFILTTANILGGQNYALGIVFFAGGIFCVLANLAILIMSIIPNHSSKHHTQLKWD